MSTASANRVKEIEEQILALKNELLEARKAAGSELVDDWELTGLDGNPVRLSQLFGDQEDLFVVHNMGAGCSYCTLWADGFTSYYRFLSQRAAFVLCSADPAPAAKTFSEKHGWNYPVVSGHGSKFAEAMGYTGEDGSPWPGVSAFHKNDDGSIVRTGHAPFGPGDDFCPVWPFFDLLQDGANGWEPSSR